MFMFGTKIILRLYLKYFEKIVLLVFFFFKSQPFIIYFALKILLLSSLYAIKYKWGILKNM